MKRTSSRTIPAFVSESQEAEWWYENRRKLDADFVKAAQQGELKRLDRKTLLSRVAASTKAVSIRIPEPDLELARQQAARLGLPYQTYIKSLLHQALTRAS